MSVFGKAHSKLHDCVMQVIITQILTLTVTRLSGHCWRYCAEDGIKEMSCVQYKRVAGMLSWLIACNFPGELYTRAKYVQSLLIRNLENEKVLFDCQVTQQNTVHTQSHIYVYSVTMVLASLQLIIKH